MQTQIQAKPHPTLSQQPHPLHSQAISQQLHGLRLTFPEGFRAAFILFAFWAIVFLGHNWELGQKLDAMTNSVLAKNILRTGDWFTLHYSDVSFPDYYAHPPLPIWVQALFFKVFGISDFVARLGPGLFGLGTLAGVFILGMRMGGVFSAFISGLVLLTTSRYFKYAADAFLEGPLACLLVWGAICQFDFLRRIEFQAGTLKQRIARAGLATLFGVCVALGFLTKSVFTFSLPLASLLYFFLSRATRQSDLEIKGSGPFSLRTATVFAAQAGLGFFVVLVPWLFLGRGIEFLQGHWLEIGGRVQEHPSVESRLAPLMNLLKTYWPWLPLWIYSNYALVKGWAKSPGELRFVILFSWVQLLGLTYSGFYFEHYMVPFYPMASLGIGYFLSRLLLGFRNHVYQVAEKGALVMALVLAVFPLRLHSLHSEPIEGLLQYMDRSCQGVTQVLVSQKVMEKWMALAVVLWRTPWDAVSVTFEETSDAGKNQLFILRSSELARATLTWHGQWKQVASDGDLLLFESLRGEAVCGHGFNQSPAASSR